MIVHQAQGLRPRNTARTRGKTSSAGVLGIVSGKGGVGKSALAVNLAASAAASGASTLLIDGDLGLANADLLMGLVPRFDLADCVAGRCSLDEAVTAGPAGLELLVAGASRPAVDALASSLASRAAIASTPAPLTERLRRRDLVVLDLGAGIGSDVLALARLCSVVWLVATPEPTSLADAYTTAKHLWERASGLRIELVVNRVSERTSGERTHRALERLVQRFLGRGLPLRAILPEDPAMIRAVARQAPVVLSEPEAGIARRIRLVAESLLEETSAPSPTLERGIDATTSSDGVG